MAQHDGALGRAAWLLRLQGAVKRVVEGVKVCHQGVVVHNAWQGSRAAFVRPYCASQATVKAA
jgi:hypothetical protein